MAIETKPLPPNPFVRRLIPTVAAATLSFSACGDPAGKNNTDNNGGSNNGGSNNGASNNGGVNNGGVNNGGMNNGATNNGGVNNGGVNNGVTNNGVTNNGVTNNGTTNNGTTNNGGTNNGVITGTVTVNDDGTVTEDEIRSFCQMWSDCDTTYFENAYASVDDCTTKQSGYLAEYLTEYETNYGVECRNVYEAYTECSLGNRICLSGEVTYGATDCYENFRAQFDQFCVE